ncbi:MAG TPA: TolC family protein [Elusimicrobiales bacterium]|nr:TolC family protein [Elusimicrobiales bacterium]
MNVNTTKGTYPLKTRIKQAALALFAKHGMENVAVRDIVRKAGTTQPMLYYYYGSRDKLCLNLFEELVREMVTGAEKIINGAEPLEPKMKQLFCFYGNFLPARPGDARFILQGYLSPNHRQIFKQTAEKSAVEYRQKLMQMLKEHEKKGELPHGHTDVLMELMGGMFLHFMFNSRMPQGRRQNKSMPDKIASLICKGAGAACGLLVTILLASGTATAQSISAMSPMGISSSTSPHAWTLEQCLMRAMEVNPSMQSSREGLTAAKGQNQMALSEFVPRVNWSTVYINNDKTSLGSLAASIPGLRPSMSSKDYYLSSLSADQTLFSWRMSPLRRTMKANTKLAALKLAAAENDTVLNVKKAFYTSLYAKQLLIISQAAEAVAKENLETSQALYKEGKVSTFDVSRASVRHVNAKTATISARNTLTVSLEALRVLLSLPVSDTFDIEGDFPDIRKETLLSDEINSALAHRPELGQAKAAEDLQTSAKELAKAGFLPTVFAGFTYSWEGIDLAPGSGNDYKSWTAKAGISIPIFDGMFSIGRFKSQKAGLAQAKEQSRAAADGVIMEVRQYYYSLASSRESLQAQKENVETAAENLRIAQERYKLGLLSLLDLKDAELSNIEARTQQVKALYDYNIAFTSLARATGLPAANN